MIKVRRGFNSEDSEANLAEVEDEQSDRQSQVACESLDSFPVSIKHGLRTADHGLRTGYKIRTRYKMGTTD